MTHYSNQLCVKSFGIETYKENVIFMRSDCHICKSEGYTALTRLVIHYNTKSIIATLNVVHSDVIKDGETILSEIAFRRLEISEGEFITVSHSMPLESLSDARSKMYLNKLDRSAYEGIINDISNDLYSNIELAAFISGCSGDNLDLEKSVCIGIHGIFAGNVSQELLNASAKEVVTCNSIPHPSNKIDITDILYNTIIQ